MTEMNHNQIANSACDAFDIIANSVINKATFDKTIIGVIVSCADAELGQYKVLYQDAHYYATVSNTEDSYNTGDNVYILIPENDLTKPKKILGAVENLGDNYLAQTNIDSQFDTIGENAITVENNYINDFSYCSYKGEEYEVLYDVNNIENNKININTMAFAGSARSAEKLQITAKIKTLIPAEQLNGNFGLKVDIETYVDLETEDTVVKTYILDINSMVGTIYNLSNYLTQSTLLDFNGSMFKRITKITAFIKDFQKDNDKINMDDIYISDIGIFAMISANEKSWNTYYLTLETPNGVSLSKSLTSLTLNARVVYKNREVSNSKLNYYWFLKDMSISKTNDKYCVHGGQGWYCLNEYKDGKWVPANFSYNISNTKMLGNSAEYKCVAVLDDIAIAYNQKTIYNEDAEYIVSMDVLDLPSKTFYANQGTASLTCNVQDSTQKEISNIDDFIFHWGRLDSQGNYLDFDVENGSSEQIIDDIINPLTNAELLKKTKILFTRMETILSQNVNLRKDYFFSTSRFEDKDKELTYFNIKNILETVFNMKYGDIIAKKYKNEQILTKIQEFIDSQKVLSCVVKNIFHNLKASIINERNTFTCTVYKIDQNTGEELYIGTDSLIISNLISPANATYKINLINKNQVFKYNESGKSPTHHTYESPQEILPLSFELFDNNNTKIDLSQSQSAVVRWYIPIEDTLLILPEDIDEEKKSIDETNTYYIINDSTLSFEIADTYDMNKRNNNILLEVIYNTFNEKISTNFSFFKEGFMGTNGSDYFCRIVPNHITNNYPTLYCYNNKNNEFKVESNFTGGEENINNGKIPWFSVELWDGGEQLDLSMANIEWKILTNGKETPLEILDKSNQNVFIQLNENIFKKILNENISPCLIIQASVSYVGKKYFATQPLAISYSQGTELKYKLNIKAKTGFNEAIYSNDGVNPQFNSATPFEAEVLLADSINITDDNNTVTITDLNITAIETENDEYQTPLAFDWTVFKDSVLKTKKALNALDYQIKCQPPDIYDGLNVSNGIVLKIGKRNINGELETEYQRLYFPIHLYLNRYGHSHLNEWDGNSIQISEEEGYILSPQIGAGKKNDDNTFTGMLMGEVKGGLKNKTGLLGYGHGIQTMFLDAETGSAYFGKNKEIAIEPKNEDTQIKLGTWYLDKEAIWQSSDGTKIFGGDDPYYDPVNPNDAKNLYFGQKGLSLDNKMIFFNQGVRAEEEDKNFITIDNIKYKSERGPGTLKIGPWFIETTAFWKGDPDLGGGYLKWLNGTEIYPKPEPVAEPIQVDHPGARPEKPTEVQEPDEDTGTEEEWQKYNDYLEALEAYNEAIKTYDSDLKKYNQYLVDKDKYDEYLNNLQLYEGNLQIIKKENANDIYLGNNGFSLSNFLVYSSNENTLKIDGQLNCTNSLSEDNNTYYLQIYNTEKDTTKNKLLTLGLNPNKIYFYDSTAKVNDNDIYTSVYAKYIYGKGSVYKNIATSGSRINGNHLLFNRPICICDGIRFGSSGVQLMWIAKTSEGNLQFNIGASRSDSFDNTYTAAHRPRTTRLMGRTLYLYAYGTKSAANTFNGTVYGYAGRYVFYNKNSKKPYISRAWTTSSDERLKNLKPLDERYYTFFSKLNPLAYTWKEDGENGKVNIGYSAQQVKQALFDSGLKLNDFAGLSIDYDNEDAKEKGIEDYHTLSYEEFGPIYAAVLQRALKKIDELEERIKDLEK